MRYGTRMGRRAPLWALLAMLTGMLAAASPAMAGGNGNDNGLHAPHAAFTTINSVDGPNTCKNGSPDVNCNQYYGKSYVWLDGGPSGTNFARDGQYFFVVLEPGGQKNDVNDHVPAVTGDKNLSDDSGPYTDRTFTVKNGQITEYHGSHQLTTDPVDGKPKIRLFPYADSHEKDSGNSSNAPYILEVCYLGNGSLSSAADDHYPVDEPNDCKMDMFKMIPSDDSQPPSCPPVQYSVVGSDNGATQTFQDAGGIDSIDVLDMTNVNYTLTGFYPGTTGPVTINLTQLYHQQTTRARIVVRDVAGNVAECDPVITRLHVRRHRSLSKTFRRLAPNDDTVVIRNGRPGLRKLRVTVNHHRHFTVRLKPGERRKLKIGSALKKKRNTVTLRGFGRRGAHAQLMIAN